MKTFLASFRSAFRGFILLIALAAFFPAGAMADAADDWFIAVKNDRDGKVKDMLQQGFNPNTIERTRGDTALILAMREDSMEVFNILLADKRIKLDISANNGDNALMIACYRGNEEAVKKLLQRGAKVNKDGWSPLHYAAANGNLNIIKMLLKKDAFVNAVSPNGTTPVMMAARGGHIHAVKILHDNGADLTIVNQRGYSAVRFAQEHKNTAIATGIEYQIKKEEELERRKKILPKFPF